MEQVLQIREAVVRFVKKYEAACIFVVKFLMGLVVFGMINSIPFGAAPLAFLTKPNLGLPLTLLFSLAFAALSFSASYLLIILDIALHLSASLEVCVMVTLFLLCVQFLYARLAPQESMLLILAFFAYSLNVPYILPLVAGLYFSAASIIPVTLGVFICNLIPVAGSLLASARTAGLNFMEMPATFSELYMTLLSSVLANQEWILTAFIFVMAALLVYAVSRMSMDYAKDWAVGLGCALMIVSFIIAVLITSVKVNLFTMILCTILSGLLVEIFRFFDCVLDYQRVERVEFEDDENLYYVKIVPKIILTRRKRVVRRIYDRRQHPGNDEPEIEEGDTRRYGAWKAPDEDEDVRRYEEEEGV
jgi:hypothetical protein